MMRGRREPSRDMTEETREQEREASIPGDRDTPEPAGERKRGGGMKRARGGAMHHPDAADEHKKHMPGEHKRVMHHHPRKRGGKVPHGEKPKERPDRRARGGATADMNPLTAAGKMSIPDYERGNDQTNGGGRGHDSKGITGRD
jgi:hypothetical protein